MNRLLLLMTVFCYTAGAIETGYLSVKEPAGWTCQSEEGLFKCQGNGKNCGRDSVMLLLSQTASSWDSLPNYDEYLRSVKTIVDDAGKPVISTISYTNDVDINGFPWIDSLQYNSELPLFWTRYLATLIRSDGKNRAVLLTLLVSDRCFAEMENQFGAVVRSLKPSPGTKSFLKARRPKK